MQASGKHSQAPHTPPACTGALKGDACSSGEPSTIHLDPLRWAAPTPPVLGHLDLLDARLAQAAQQHAPELAHLPGEMGLHPCELAHHPCELSHRPFEMTHRPFEVRRHPCKLDPAFSALTL